MQVGAQVRGGGPADADVYGDQQRHAVREQDARVTLVVRGVGGVQRDRVVVGNHDVVEQHVVAGGRPHADVVPGLPDLDARGVTGHEEGSDQRDLVVGG